MAGKGKLPPTRPIPRGVEPQSLQKWVLAVSKDGARKFRVYLAGEKEPKLVALRNSKATSATIEAMAGATHVEAIGDENEILRVWQFAEQEAAASSEDALPGYLKEEGDSEDVRMLKTFAHLLSDAHRMANQKLVEVVGIQAKHFQEERSAHLQLRSLNERLMQSLAKKVARIRIANGEDPEDAAAGEEAETPDTFLQDLVAPLLQKYVQQKVRTEAAEAVAAAAAPAANGAREE